jgi:uncharacterized protein YicC (UPF0701 family)
MTREEAQDIKEKIVKGINIAYQNLLSMKLKEGGELVVSQKGKVLRIKASELAKY